MAKKKAQHLYELLGQKAQEALQVSKESAAKESEAVRAPASTPDLKPSRRRYSPGVSAPVQTPMPAATGHEHALENVVTIRRDTAIVGALMVIVLLVVAFVVGRATAPHLRCELAEVRHTRQALLPGEIGVRHDSPVH